MERSEEFTKIEAIITQAQDLPAHKGHKLLSEGVYPAIEEMARRGQDTDADDLRKRAVHVASALNEKHMILKQGASAVHSQQ